MTGGAETPLIDVRDLTVRHETGVVAARRLNLAIPRGSIYAIIGPAASGKTSLLRTINLLSLEVDHATAEGQILIAGRDVLAPGVDRTELRRRVGMVFATPLPLPGTIYDNLAFGPRVGGQRRRAVLDETVESSLRAAELWHEVKDRLREPASTLSGGQQQRLCIARTLALAPEVVLLDEPCSGLDPISTLRIEETMRSLRARVTFVLVTNNTKQAGRVSDRTAFMLLGDLIEDGATSQLFTVPRDRRTADYIEGRFG